MSELDSLIEEAQDILANGQNSPFRPVVLLRMFIRLAQEVERIDSERAQAGTGSPSVDASSGAAHPRPAAKKSSQRKEQGQSPKDIPATLADLIELVEWVDGRTAP